MARSVVVGVLAACIVVAGTAYYFGVHKPQKEQQEKWGGASLGEIGGLQYVYWNFGNSNFRSLSVTIEIYNEPSFEDGLFFQMYQGEINDVGFYFGIQTDVYRPGVGSTGRGLIFSRWGTRDLSNVRTVEGGWAQSARYEGDFIGIRKNYEWGVGVYRLEIAYLDTDNEGDWYGVWIFDLDNGAEDFLGSIRFPKAENAGIRDGGVTWIELYYKKIQETPLPTWHVSVINILADGELPPKSATSAYSAIARTNVYYDNATGEVHFTMGHEVNRTCPAGQLF